MKTNQNTISTETMTLANNVYPPNKNLNMSKKDINEYLKLFYDDILNDFLYKKQVSPIVAQVDYTIHESYIIRQYNAIIDTAMLNDDFDLANIVATIFKQFDTHTKTTFITQDLTPEAIVAALYENKTADIKFEENYYIVYLPDGDSFDFEKISSVEALLKEEKLLGYWMGGGEYPKCNIKWISFEV